MATYTFVIGGICHSYSFSEENLKGRFGRIFNDVLYAFHPLLKQGRDVPDNKSKEPSGIQQIRVSPGNVELCRRGK